MLMKPAFPESKQEFVTAAGNYNILIFYLVLKIHDYILNIRESFAKTAFEVTKSKPKAGSCCVPLYFSLEPYSRLFRGTKK